MEVILTDTFFESLDRVASRERWYWKVWDFVRYDFPRGVKNLVFFFKAVWNYRGWDYHGSLVLLRRSLEPIHGYVLNGHEIEEPRLKKAYKIRRTIELLRRIETDCFVELAEAELGYSLQYSGLFEDAPDRKEANSAIFAKSHEYEEAAWEELWSNLKGQDTSDFRPKGEESFEDAETRWYKKFDGSGIRGWWD
jgi:hypothetical protein